MKILWKMEHLLQRANAPFSIIFSNTYSNSKASKGAIMEYKVKGQVDTTFDLISRLNA